MTKTDRLMRQIAAQLVRLARAEIAAIEREAAPKGKGQGHFRTVADIQATVDRHEVEITKLKLDVSYLGDLLVAVDRRSKRRGHT